MIPFIVTYRNFASPQKTLEDERLSDGSKGYGFFFSSVSHIKLSVVQKNREEGENCTVIFFPSVFGRKKKTIAKKIVIGSQTGLHFSQIWG